MTSRQKHLPPAADSPPDADDGTPVMRFDLLRPSLGSSVSAGGRLGRLAFPGRLAVETPNFVAATSRGCVPHLTPDNVHSYTSFGGVYVALEDFVEPKAEHAVLNSLPSLRPSTTTTNATPLHALTALPPSLPVFLSPRRCPPVAAPTSNRAGHSHVSIFTSTGFRDLTVPGYAENIRALRPDAVVGMGDAAVVRTATGGKLVRAAERTEEWVGKLLDELEGLDDIAIFAPVLQVPYPQQWEYLTDLADDYARRARRISGLAFYDADLVLEIAANHQDLAGLPRLSLQPVVGPHQLLRQVSLGIDMFPLSFVNTASDAGVALVFAFPAASAPPAETASLPLGIDMLSAEHAASLDPIVEGCSCYTCAKHHRAFVNHLLNAKEMLGWTLLQVHNFHVATSFFAGVRAVLAEDDGGERLEEAAGTFYLAYDTELPAGTGTRPRARGYHFKSEAGQEKINQASWSKYEGGDGTVPGLEPGGGDAGSDGAEGGSRGPASASTAAAAADEGSRRRAEVPN